MFLKQRIELRKKKLNKFVEKYGLQDSKTMKLSQEIDELLNKYNKEKESH